MTGNKHKTKNRISFNKHIGSIYCPKCIKEGEVRNVFQLYVNSRGSMIFRCTTCGLERNSHMKPIRTQKLKTNKHNINKR
jgi:uncharacterized Zn finger protein